MRKGKSTRLGSRFARQKTNNMLLQGGGAETLQDRGSIQTASNHTLNPYYNNNFIARWQEYVRWYATSWEARKIVDIPVQDALREPVELHGLEERDRDLLLESYMALELDKQLRRALVQERLLGGCVLLGVFKRPQEEETAEPLPLSEIAQGDLEAVNLVDVGRLSRPDYDTDPFSVAYDRIESLQVTGVQVHASRLCVFDGTPLLGRGSQMIMESFRYNPCGFGESVLAPLYDLLVRVIGTQQGAYHLVNLASVLVLAADNLRLLNATGSPAKAKLEEMAEQISIYRAAIVDLKGVEFKQHAASFGSVPELVMTFLQILSAGSDIPATRFLGQAPGGLNATGTSDLENYYNSIRAWQQTHIKPIQRKLFDWVGCSLWGGPVWLEKSKGLTFEYPPLWNQTALEKAQTESTVALFIRSLTELGVISAESALQELKDRGIFMSDVQPGDFMSMVGDTYETSETLETSLGRGFRAFTHE